MNIQAVKLELVQKLLSVKNEQVLTKINQILEKEVIVAYTTKGKPLTKEQYNKSLLAAEKQIKAGKYITHDALINKSAK